MVVALERVDAGFRAVGLAMAPDFFDSLPTNAHVYNQLIAHMAEFGSPVLELDEAESDAVRRAARSTSTTRLAMCSSTATAWCVI